jgi:hypothetical protein
VQARKDWRERALTHAGRVPSERVQRLELPAEPAPGGAETVTSGSVSVTWPQATFGNINAPIAKVCDRRERRP